MYRRITDLKIVENVNVESGVDEMVIQSTPTVILENPDYNFELTLLMGIFGGDISNVKINYMLLNKDVPGIIESDVVNTGPLTSGVPYIFKIPMIDKDIIDKIDITYIVKRNPTSNVSLSSTIVVYEEY